jgi:hypothetical protein
MSKHHHHKNRHKHRNRHFKLYYGIPHAHCSYSTGKGTPSEAFRYARQKKINYLILTDHVSPLNQSISLKDKKISKWEAQKIYAHEVTARHKNFTALCGYECKIRSVGDINIYNNEMLPNHNFKNITQFISWLNQNENSIGCINHPHGNISLLLKFPELNNYISVMEVGNGSYPNRYTRYYERFFEFLDNGWKLGAVIGQDNHRNNWGDDEKFTFILAENLSSSSIMDAYRNRRTYASESSSLKLKVTVNTAVMGETLTRSENESLNFSIKAEDSKYAIEKFEIITNGGQIIKTAAFNSLSKAELAFSHAPSLNESWYSVIIYQCNKKQALASPIFIEKKACD